VLRQPSRELDLELQAVSIGGLVVPKGEFLRSHLAEQLPR
jgi:hypothetical protein